MTELSDLNGEPPLSDEAQVRELAAARVLAMFHPDNDARGLVQMYRYLLAALGCHDDQGESLPARAQLVAATAPQLGRPFVEGVLEIADHGYRRGRDSTRVGLDPSKWSARDAAAVLRTMDAALADMDGLLNGPERNAEVVEAAEALYQRLRGALM